MAVTRTSDAKIADGQVVYPSSVQSNWVIAHESLEATAETGTVLLTPATYAGTGVHPVKLSGAVTRVLIRARYDVGTTTLTTSPVVRLYAVFTPLGTIPATGVIPNDGTVRFVRIDNADNNAAGVILTLSANAIRDSVYRYTNVVSLTGSDMLGACHLLVLTETAGAVSGGANTNIDCEVLLVN